MNNGVVYTKPCKNCNAQIPIKANKCMYCNKSQGGMPTWLIVLLCILGFFFVVGVLGSEDTEETKEENKTEEKSENKTENKEENKTENKPSIQKEQILYNQNNIIVKVKDFEIGSFSNSITLKVYVENNSNKEVTVELEDPTIDGYQLSTWFYESLNPGVKKNEDLYISNLSDNGLKAKNVSEISLKLGIFDSSTYKDIVKEKKVTYKLK